MKSNNNVKFDVEHEPLWPHFIATQTNEQRVFIENISQEEKRKALHIWVLNTA